MYINPEQMAAMSPEDRAKAVKIYTTYIQARTCNVLGAVFGICGFFVFAILYQRFVSPDVVGALRNASTLGMVIFPFVPAFVFMLAGRRYEKRYLALTQKQ